MKRLIYTILTLSLSANNYAQIIINEVMTSNLSAGMDDSYNFPEFIEIYNTGTTTYYFSGIYLSNDIAQLAKFKISEVMYPSIGSKKFLVFWCDKKNTANHTSFRIKSGQTIFISNGVTILDSISLGVQYLNSSYGRSPDGSATWTHFLYGTPGKTNNGKTGTKQLEKVHFNLSGGFYSGKQTLTLTASDGNIYYTTDGSEPKETSKLYSAPIGIDTTTVIRASAFKDGDIAGEPVTHTYFISERAIQLPVISISTDPKYFFDNTIGIYIAGTNGITGMCSTPPVNWNQDWERTINFELFDVSKKMQINQIAGTRINGNCSRTKAMKSLGIYSDDKYGQDRFDYEFFNFKKNLTMKTVLLRNGGNEWNVTMIREAFHHVMIQGRLNMDFLSYQPSVVFLNGQYWGIHNIREKPGDDNIWSNYHIDTDSMDVLQNNASVDNGSNADYNSMINYIKSNDMSQKVHYEYVCSKMDMDNYLDYIILEMFIANTDWPGNNIKYWRSWRPGSKWRWILWDTDFGFGYSKAPSFDMLTFSTLTGGAAWPNPDWSTLLIRNLLKNDTFKTEFINRFSVYMGGCFRKERTLALIDSLAGNIQNEISYHLARWNSGANWNYNLNVMRTFGTNRPDFVYTHLQNFFGLGYPMMLQCHSTVDNASFVINNVISPDTVFSGKYFKSSFLKIKPLAPSGYKFKYWKVTYDNTMFDQLLKKGEIWSYLDTNFAPAAGWNATGFDDSSWKTGQAELGYGDGDEKTKIRFGPNANNKFIASYYRKKITIADTNAMANLVLEGIFDDGIIIYINGTELTRSGMPAGAVTYNTLANASNENASVSIPLNKNKLVIGENIFAAEVHQSNVTSSDVSFEMSVRYTIPGTTPPDSTIYSEVIADTMRYGMNLTAYWDVDTVSRKKIFINEICAANSKEEDEFGQTDDWIELYNPNDTAMDIGGMFLTDSLPCPAKYQIPRGYPQFTVIPAKGYLRLWADEQHYQGKLHLAFKFERLGEQAGICYKKGEEVVWLDSLSYGYQDDLYSFGRYKDGTPSWQYMPMTPEKTNVKGYPADSITKNIKINEICASNNSYADEKGHFHDWFEVYNPGSDSVDLAGLLFTDTTAIKGLRRIPYGFPKQTIIPPKEFRVIWCDNSPEEGPLHLNLRLDKNGEMVGIYQMMYYGNFMTDTIKYPVQQSGISYGRYTDGMDSLIFMPLTPGAANEKLIIPVSLITNEGLLLYPNPATTVIYLDMEGMENANIRVYSMQGIVVYEKKAAENPVEINVQDLSQGTYVIKIQSEKGNRQMRFVKQ